MTNYLILLLFTSLVMLDARELTAKRKRFPNAPKYSSGFPGYLLPMFLVFLMLAPTVFSAVTGYPLLTLYLLFPFFLAMCIYYPLLLALNPLLRKCISARTCAILWLIPTYLFFLDTVPIPWERPLAIWVVPGKTIWVLGALWFLGFAGVLGWKLLEHLQFRRWVLTDTAYVEDAQICDIWFCIMDDAKIPRDRCKLLVSPHLSSPVTVGLRRKHCCVILPQTDYSPEEWELILRHELVHIGQEDSWKKFFMVFCTAMCWFNPLMWLAMGKCAEELELSCDETVLENCDKATRKRYADLLLTSAGDSRGFSTCLSATAKSLRYRLKNVVRPGKRLGGAILAGVLFLGLGLCRNAVALVYDGELGMDRLFRGEPAGYVTDTIHIRHGEEVWELEHIDQDALNDYLASLELYCMTGDYRFGEDAYSGSIRLDYDGGILILALGDQTIETLRVEGSSKWGQTFYIPEGMDWEFMMTLGTQP